MTKEEKAAIAAVLNIALNTQDAFGSRATVVDITYALWDNVLCEPSTASTAAAEPLEDQATARAEFVRAAGIR